MDDSSIQVVPLECDADTENLYHYTQCGLTNYWLSPGLFIIGEYYEEETITFPKLYEVQAVIGMHICSLKRPLGPREIRFLRGEFNWSQTELGHALGYRDKQTVAKAEKWLEDGLKSLMGPADLLLRRIYLTYLGELPLIGDEYRNEAISLGANMTKPHLIEEKNWQIAA